MEQKFIYNLAKKIDDEFEKEYFELEELGKDFSSELDRKLLEAAKFYDREYAGSRKKRKNMQLFKKIAVFILAFISVNAVAIGTSDAYRQFIFHGFENEDNDSITFRTQAEQDMIGIWTDYWYPAYLPENYEIVAAEESGKTKYIQIQTTSGTLLISEYIDGGVISFDTKDTNISDIYINNSVGKKILNGNQTIIVYPTEMQILEFSFDSEILEQDIIEIAENMKYVK